jgi:hypothetical protein
MSFYGYPQQQQVCPTCGRCPTCGYTNPPYSISYYPTLTVGTCTDVPISTSEVKFNEPTEGNL